MEAGMRFGRLTFIKIIGRTLNRHLIGMYKCDCGTIKPLINAAVRYGKINSCGCLRREKTREMSTKHGLTGTWAEQSYRGMIVRCYHKKCPAYKNYGGRGIKVCKRWLGENGLINFVEDMGQPSSRIYSIDRINNEKGYSPNNCRWASPYEQNQNTRIVCKIKYKNKIKTLTAWAKDLKIKKATLYARLFIFKWPIEKAFTQKVQNWRT